MNNESSDEILDNINKYGFLEYGYMMFIQKNIIKYSNFNIAKFNGVWYALISDTPEDLKEEDLNTIEDSEGLFECLDVLYSELFEEAKKNFTFDMFKTEIYKDNKENINKIFTDLNNTLISSNVFERVYCIYELLKNRDFIYFISHNT